MTRVVDVDGLVGELAERVVSLRVAQRVLERFAEVALLAAKDAPAASASEAWWHAKGRGEAFSEVLALLEERASEPVDVSAAAVDADVKKPFPDGVCCESCHRLDDRVRAIEARLFKPGNVGQLVENLRVALDECAEGSEALAGGYGSGGTAPSPPASGESVEGSSVGGREVLS